MNPKLHHLRVVASLFSLGSFAAAGTLAFDQPQLAAISGFRA